MNQENYSDASLIMLAIIEMLPNSTRESIIDSSINSLYLDYFSAAETLESLLKHNLVHASINKGEAETTASGKPVYRLNITNEGHAILKALKNTIPKQVFEFLTQLSEKKAKKEQLIAKYEINANHNFIITLGQENNREKVISLTLTVPTEQMAKQICQKWQNDANTIYQEIFQLLIED